MSASVGLFLALSIVPAGAGQDRTDASPAGPLYLSLGDSMAFGLQFDRLFEMLDEGTYSPDAFDTGFSDLIAGRLRGGRADLEHSNLSCPGETTVTMASGGCFFTSPEPDGAGLTLHVDYDGSQLDEATSILHTRGGEDDLVTLTIGGNDVATVIADQCEFDAACVTRSGVGDRLRGGLDHILGALLDAAPGAKVVLVAFYNPFTVSAPSTTGLWHRHYTRVQEAAAARHGVEFVDLSVLLDRRNVCDLTFMCSSGDPHPTDLGYRVIADEVLDAIDAD